MSETWERWECPYCSFRTTWMNGSGRLTVEAHIAWCARMNPQVDALKAADALAKAVEDWKELTNDPEVQAVAVWPRLLDALAEYRKARGAAPEPILSDLGT